MESYAVLIPAYNEALVIEGTLDALIKAGVEVQNIYVVDDLSTDNTAELVKVYGVNLFTVPYKSGKALAQVQAIKHFQLIEKYRWVILLDGDSKVEENCISSLIAAAKAEPHVALFVGQIKSVEADHLFSAYRAFEYTFSHDLAKEAQNRHNVVYVSPGCASMYRTDILAQLNIDHKTLAEDMDLTIQVHRLKQIVRYVSTAGVKTQDPSTLTDYKKQITRWYRGFWQVVLKHNILWWGPKGKVDFYMWMIIIDAVIFNRLFCIVGLLMLFPNISYQAMVFDIAIAFGIACYCGYRTRRLDVLYKFPQYYWLGYLNFYAFAKSFFEIMVLRKEILAWNHVKRYEFSQPKEI